MAFLNPWSICNKTTSIFDFLESNALDIFAVAESWLQSDGNEPQRLSQHEMMPPSYNLIFVPRPDGRKGGGISIIFKKSIQVNIVDFSKSSSQFEFLVCAINIHKFVFKLMVLYRPNPTASNNLNVKLFWKDFERLMSKHATCTQEIIITGDLNFHLDNIESNNTILLHSVLDEYGLEQKIAEPTHVAGHTLDVLIVRSDSSLLKSIQVRDPALVNEYGKLLKDHYAIHWSMDIMKPQSVVKKIAYRDLKNIDYDQLSHDLQNSNLGRVTSDDTRSVTDLTDLYNDTLRSLLDKAAPLKTKTIVVRDNAEWYTNAITLSKRHRRQTERQFMRTKSVVDHQLYREQCGITSRLIRRTKREFYSSKIMSANRDHKTIFRLANSWMGSNKNVLPTHDCEKTLANVISQFFVDKAKKIHTSLKDTLDPSNPYIPVKSDLDAAPTQYLHIFEVYTPAQVRELTMSSASKHCELDPAPTTVVKKLVDLLLPAITLIINKSLTSGTVPTSMKRALVRPSLKQASLNPEELSSYRPVSNLSFLSKLVEKAANKRLDSHLEGNSLLSDSQSAYRKRHSTETLLIKVQSDILESLDSGYATILVMLDISAAFDVVDHQRLLSRHKELFGVDGTALKWLSSYLSGRTQCVVIGKERSEEVDVNFGFPQGSVLGGKKFIMYATPLGTLILHHDVEHKCYADDTQKYLSFRLKDKDSLKSAVSKLQSSLSAVQLWMSANMLKMNNGKTELIVFAPKSHLQDLADLTVNVGGKTIELSPAVDNLGVIFDSALSMKQQVNSV